MIELPEIIQISEDNIFYIEDADLPKLKKWLIEYELNSSN